MLAKEFGILANSRDFRPVQRPQEWSYSLTTLLAKKPWPTELSQFRPISLMPHLQKLYTKWLYSRARPFIEEYLPVEQHGFRRGRQCAEILHAFARLREHTAEWRETFVLMKLDIAKAFDKVRRSALLRAMRDTGIPPRIVWALSREMLQSFTIPSLYAITTEAPIETHRGVRQGAPDSGPVFCVCLAAALRQTLQKLRDLNYGHAIGPFRDLSAMLGFADDTLLLAKSPWEAQRMFEDVREGLNGVGLPLNASKTQYIATFPETACQSLPGENRTNKGMLVLGKDVDVVDSTARDIQTEEQRAWANFHKLKPILRQRTAVRHRFRATSVCHTSFCMGSRNLDFDKG